jgi:hypothetical protein
MGLIMNRRSFVAALAVGLPFLKRFSTPNALDLAKARMPEAESFNHANHALTMHSFALHAYSPKSVPNVGMGDFIPGSFVIPSSYPRPYQTTSLERFDSIWNQLEKTCSDSSRS